MMSQNYSELESQFILRMPVVKDDSGNIKAHPATAQLREALLKANTADQTANLTDNLKDRLFIELNSETRKGKIKFDNEIFEGRLVDLPCCIESLKTVDKKTFFKTADICQMLICKPKDEPWSSSDEESSKKKEKKKTDEKTSNVKKYQWPHGIAPPLKNVRRKRFRKVAKKKIIDYVEIEKEVKQLFRADREAVKIDYEVVLVDGELEDENNDDENKNLLNNDEDFDDSSQEDENNAMMMGAECSNTGYLDSIQDNLTSTNMASGPTKLKKVNKSGAQIEESNMSSAIDDDDSIMMNSATKLKLNKDLDNEENEVNNQNPSNFDELSNDNSNFAAIKLASKRTGFKNLFVEQVIGDLSSSEEDDDKNDEEDDEDEEELKNKKTSFRFNLNKNSVHHAKDSENDESKLDQSATVGPGEVDDSMSNFDDLGFGNVNESSLSNLGAKKSDDKTKNKNIDLMDGNTMDGEEDEDDDEDEEDDEDLGDKKKNIDLSKNFPSSLSSSPASGIHESNENKSELRAKLNKLMDELQRIKEERRKREIEINPINNPVLKAHLSSRLNNLIEEENKKTSEIEEVKSLLNE